MNSAEYRAAAERIVTRDTYRFGGIHPDDLRKAEIFAQLALSAAISETKTSAWLNPSTDSDSTGDNGQSNNGVDARDAASHS